MRDLIGRCLSVVPTDRPSVEDILRHQWMQESCEPALMRQRETNVERLGETELKSAVDERSGAACSTAASRAQSAPLSLVDQYSVDADPQLSPPQRLLDTVELSTKPLTEKAVELYASSTSDRCVELYADQSSESCIELNAGPSSDGGVELCGEQLSDLRVELSAAPSSDRGVELYADQSSDKYVELSAGSSSDRCVELYADQSSDKCVELYADQSSDRCVELSTGTSSDRCVELFAGQSSDRCAELYADQSSDRCVELCAASYKNTDELNTVDTCCDLSSDKCAELYAESLHDKSVECSTHLLSEKTVDLHAAPSLHDTVKLCATNHRHLSPLRLSRAVELCAELSSSVHNASGIQQELSAGRDDCVGRLTETSVCSLCGVDYHVAPASGDSSSQLPESVDHLCRHFVKLS